MSKKMGWAGHVVKMEGQCGVHVDNLFLRTGAINLGVISVIHFVEAHPRDYF
jgi:hypothetical protein